MTKAGSTGERPSDQLLQLADEAVDAKALARALKVLIVATDEWVLDGWDGVERALAAARGEAI